MHTWLRPLLWAAAAGALAAAVALAAIGWIGGIGGGNTFSGDQGGTAQVGGPFTLVDQTGRNVTEQDFRGRYMLVYFGYTFCPDVCPTGLQVMSQALDRLDPELAERITPVFVTVDPERDTVEQMAAYAGHFHPRLVALTGTPEQVAEAAREFRVFYRKAEDSGSTEYLMDHSSIIYLMSPDGRYLTHYTHQTPVDEMTSGLQAQLAGAGA